MLDQPKEIAKQRNVAAYSFALVYAVLGEGDQAFQWLERELTRSRIHKQNWESLHARLLAFHDQLQWFIAGAHLKLVGGRIGRQLLQRESPADKLPA